MISLVASRMAISYLVLELMNFQSYEGKGMLTFLSLLA